MQAEIKGTTMPGRAWIELSGELVHYALAPGQTLMVHPGPHARTVIYLTVRSTSDVTVRGRIGA